MIHCVRTQQCLLKPQHNRLSHLFQTAVPLPHTLIHFAPRTPSTFSHPAPPPVQRGEKRTAYIASAPANPPSQKAKHNRPWPPTAECTSGVPCLAVPCSPLPTTPVCRQGCYLRSRAKVNVMCDLSEGGSPHPSAHGSAGWLGGLPHDGFTVQYS